MTEQSNATPSDDSKDAELARLIQAAVANNLSGGGPSSEVVTKSAVLSVLSHLGGGLTQEDSLFFEGDKFVLPKQYKGRAKEAAAFLLSWDEQQETETDMKKTFPYRPYDVAHAVQDTMKKLFGTTGTGQAIQTMFGSIPPSFISVPVGVDQTVQVPWEKVRFDIIQGSIYIGAIRSPQGIVGQLIVTAPRRYRSVIEGFFTAVEDELKSSSIYKGKAVINGNWDNIQFLDLSRVKREDVIYGDSVMTDLEANLWVPIQHTELMREMGQPIKRAVLLEGPYGTGKSLAGYLTAQVCVANGWTFIFVKPGDDLNDAMQMAKLYAPAVVFFEDIDVLQSNDPEAVSKLLDSFDGISGKGQEVIAVLTTNNRDKIHKGMLRPGRLDALIHIAELDRGGVEKLIKASTPAEYLDDDIDYANVFIACEGYLPAFVREVAARAFRYAMAHNGGKPNKLVTEDFEAAANSLREQFNLMTGAHEVQPNKGLDLAFADFFKESFGKVQVFDRDGDPSYSIGKFVVEG